MLFYESMTQKNFVLHQFCAFATRLSSANVVKTIRKKVMDVLALYINCGKFELSYNVLKRVLYTFGNPQATYAKNILYHSTAAFRLN